MHDLFSLVAELPKPSGVAISADALLPLLALVTGAAIGTIRAYAMARDVAYNIQYDAIVRRLNECEKHRDEEQSERDAERDKYRAALADAHAENADLRAQLGRDKHAGA